MHREPNNLRFALHGLAVEVACDVPGVDEALGRLLEPFLVSDWPDGFSPLTGVISSYREDEVLRHLSAQAGNIPSVRRLLDLYQDNERFWAIDDRAGLSELNLLKGQWRTWLLPHARPDSLETLEFAALWPIAQLLRTRGLHLLPALSIARDNWAGLILSPIDITAELQSLLEHGYRVIGQRWTALREEDGRVALLHLPGPGSLPPGATLNHAFCDQTILVRPGRHPRGQTRQIAPADSIQALRGAWPIDELHPRRLSPRLPARLAETTRCVEMQLSDRAEEIVGLLDALQTLPATRWYAGATEPETLLPIEVEILTDGAQRPLAKAS